MEGIHAHGDVPPGMACLKERSNSALEESPSDSRPRVTFLPQPQVAVVESSWVHEKGSFVKMAKQLYEIFDHDEVTDDMLLHAAELFSQNYGVWGEQSSRQGKRVTLNGRRLRAQYLPDNSKTSYVRVTVDGTLAGNAFACRWSWDGKTVCWVTQLVVGKDYRDRGLAKGLLGTLKEATDDVYGIMSSHPAACLAAGTTFGASIEKVSLDFIAENADSIMKASPITYVRDAKLCGSLFDATDFTGLVSGVNTNFFVDHQEPLEALRVVQETWNWPLGELPDGHEYLLIMTAKRRRSRSRSLPRSVDKHDGEVSGP
ncbi:hypothetical protein F5Y09DRAFT_319360 [Xylaria sp. FL1042]|nr:hypothetical protein F5Y09DRAFT_319360 [Xylaria sp. FL1042]